MIDLPLMPAPRSATPSLVDFGATLRPPLGGPLQRINRQGNRWTISVQMPPMRSHSEGRIWIARLVKGKTEGVRMAFPLQGFVPGPAGEPLVNGSGQSGRNLSIKSATPNYRFREGQFFSVSTGGRHHLMMVDEETGVAADGTATLPISPMLRVQHLDNDPLSVGRPMIEGFVVGDQQAWEMQLADFIGLSFDIEEVA